VSEKIHTQQREVIIVNGYATPEITEGQLTQWARNLTYLSCYSYGYTMSGDLVPLNDEEMINDAFHNGVAPLMVLTPFNEHEEYSYDHVQMVFNDPRFRDRLINNVVQTVAEKKYYGLVFNFGYIADEDRNEFVITVSKTTARLNRMGALVIVSLTPGVSDAGIDYESLGRAANLLELKPFYWEKAAEPPSAIAPIDKVKEMLAYIIAMTDPRSILLGIANYGFDWRIPYRSGTTAEMISNAEAEERASRVGAAVQYDDVLQTPYYYYTNMTGSNHMVWFEDMRSMRAKLELVGEFGLAGISIWTVMSPSPMLTQALDELYTVKKV
jgi:Predicted glycosyl hydrolase